MHLENSTKSPLRYRIPESDQILELSSSVLHVFRTYRQADSFSEAGGLLFAEFSLPRVTIKEATKPNKKDKRSKFSFIPWRNSQRKLISQRFDLGLHFVGEWHTHPEHNPSPSKIDSDLLTSMLEIKAESRY